MHGESLRKLEVFEPPGEIIRFSRLLKRGRALSSQLLKSRQHHVDLRHALRTEFAAVLDPPRPYTADARRHPLDGSKHRVKVVG